MLIWRTSLPRLTKAHDAKPISIHAIAASLNRPYETIRRQINNLINSDLCKFELGGVVISQSQQAQEKTSLLSIGILSGFHKMLMSLHESQVELPAGLLLRDISDIETLGAAMDLHLCSLEFNRPGNVALREIHILGAMLVANVRCIINDIDVSNQYATSDNIPPIELRIPVSINQVAISLGLSYATVWRNTQKMIKSGQVISYKGGYIISPEWLSRPDTVEAARNVVRYMRRSLINLSKAG